MKRSFTFRFDNPNPNLNRVYMFSLEFNNTDHYEECLDWAEGTEDISDFIKEMDRYGIHEVMFEPNNEFFGFESFEISHKDYIKVMESWRNFFLLHNIECDEIEEVVEDKLITYG